MSCCSYSVENQKNIKEELFTEEENKSENVEETGNAIVWIILLLGLVIVFVVLPEIGYHINLSATRNPNLIDSPFDDFNSLFYLDCCVGPYNGYRWWHAFSPNEDIQINQLPGYPEKQPELNKRGSVYDLGSAECHNVRYENGLYLCTLGSLEYVIDSNFTNTITKGYWNIFVVDDKIYGELPDWRGIIGYV